MKKSTNSIKTLAILRQKDVFPLQEEQKNIVYKDRLTGKAIVFDYENNVALIGNRMNPFYLLPGGGIAENESVENGIIRECFEEIGCNIELVDRVGIIEDYRTRDRKHCINYCYTAKIVGEKGKPRRIDNEIEIGMHTKWIDPKEALELFKKQKTLLDEGKIIFYNTSFNILRDLIFLEEVIASIKIHE